MRLYTENISFWRPIFLDQIEIFDMTIVISFVVAAVVWLTADQECKDHGQQTNKRADAFFRMFHRFNGIENQ